MKNLITGCGRSGTTFVAKYLQSLGMDVGHEKYIGENGVVSWYLTFGEHNSFDHIIHIIRNPYDSFKSYSTLSENAWKYIYKHLPEISPNDTNETKFVKYWCLWNREASEKAEITIKIEDLNLSVSPLLRLFDIQETEKEKQLYKDLLKEKINTRNNHNQYNLELNLNNEDLKTLKIYSKKYGYEMLR